MKICPECSTPLADDGCPLCGWCEDAGDNRVMPGDIPLNFTEDDTVRDAT